MMGAHHAACGAAAWLAITNGGSMALGWHELPVSQQLAGALVCAGAAMIPDADHHNATVAHSLPLVTKPLTKVVETVSGGHRGGTHSILGVIAFTFLAWAASLVVWDAPWGEFRWASAVLTVFLIGIALKVLSLVPRNGQKLNWLLSIGITALLVFLVPSWLEWMPLAMVVGCIVHLIGDFITTDGINLLWPIKIKPPRTWVNTPILNGIWKPNGNLALPILGNAGSTFEWVFCGGVTLYTLWLLGSVAFGAVPAEFLVPLTPVPPVR